tara:strand:- start:3164 stop:3934 length:771 start_codon:yes stop_codon:yes gene_type:complete
MIHETAIVHPSAEVADNVEIGPYAIIDKGTRIGEGTVIREHAIIRENTTIGKNNTIFQHATIGEIPQDLKFNNELTKCTIGDNNIFREYCSIHKGTMDGISDTRIGTGNLFMAYTHVAHDCIIGDNCILSNGASLAGHVNLDSNVSLGGFTLVHQFCHIGEHAFSGLGTVISQDVTPYTLVAGNHAKAYKINSVGLKRKGFDGNIILDLEKTFKLFVKSKKTTSDREKIYNEWDLSNEYTDKFVKFILKSERGITR